MTVYNRVGHMKIWIFFFVYIVSPYQITLNSTLIKKHFLSWYRLYLDT